MATRTLKEHAGAAAGLAENPYVGPVPFDERDLARGRAFYGREREAREILDLLIGMRIMLVHSPSGAGKTSLIAMKIIPFLKAADFDVLPVVRVGLEGPADDQPPDNRYLCTAAAQLGATYSPRNRELADAHGPELLLPPSGDQSQVLIFDQFEEIFSVDPVDRAQKIEFFASIGKLLRDRTRWALFAMREDYLGDLEPYADLIPNALSTRFRLDLLDHRAALLAVREPARAVGVNFTAEPAEALVRDLSEVRVAGPHGVEVRTGPYVEPVELQVVCLRLWERLHPVVGGRIEDLSSVGDVNHTLADYYADRVTAIAQRSRIPERAIRSWFDHQLITPAGVRGQVLEELVETKGLPNVVIRALVNAYLVRAERRRSMIWYELAHDRLIEPVRANNIDWFERNIEAWQHQAALWDAQGRPESLLLVDDTFPAANRWVDTHVHDVQPHERDFLRDSRGARARAQQERRSHARIKRLAIVASILSVFTILFLGLTTWALSAASESQRTAESGQLTAMAENMLADDPVGSARLARDAFAPAASGSAADEAEDVLRRALSEIRLQWTFQPIAVEPPRMTAVAYGARNELAAGSADGTVRLWRNGPIGTPETWPTSTAINALSFDEDGSRLAVAGDDGMIRIWNTNDKPLRTPTELALDRKGRVRRVQWLHGGQLLLVLSDDGGVQLWDVATNTPAASFNRPGRGWVADVSRDGLLVVTATTAGRDDHALIWDRQSGQPLHELTGHTGLINGAAFDPSARYVVTAGQDTLAQVWDASTGAHRMTLRGHTGPIWNAFFSPDGRLVVTASGDRTARVWNAQTGRQLVVLRGHRSTVTDAAFSPDGRTVATASADGTLRTWSVEPDSLVYSLPTGTGQVLGVSVSPDGQRIAAARDDGKADVWRTVDGELASEFTAAVGEVLSAAYSPDSTTLATAGADRMIRLWGADTFRLMQTLPPAGAPGPNRLISEVSFRPDSKAVIVSSDDSYAWLFDFASDKIRIARIANPNGIYGAVFSPNGLIATAGADGIARVWQTGVASDQLVEQYSQPVGRINSVAFSPDGASLATASEDGNVRVWDREARSLRYPPLRGHTGEVNGVAFSSDGRLLVSAGRDGMARVWDAVSGKLLEIVQGQTGEVSSAAFSPDGRIVLGGRDAIVEVHQCDMCVGRERLLELADQRIGRTLPDTSHGGD